MSWAQLKAPILALISSRARAHAHAHAQVPLPTSQIGSAKLCSLSQAVYILDCMDAYASAARHLSHAGSGLIHTSHAAS